MTKRIIGVLALQGDFAKHMEMLKGLHEKVMEVRKPEDLDSCDALILPGGESTTIRHQMYFIGLFDKVQEFAKKKPVFGTCAGLILMSKEIKDEQEKTLGLLDIIVERNAFGRQADSFKAEVQVELESKKEMTVPGFFIRAPRICSCDKKVKILGHFGKEPVLVQEGHLLGATFHPELTGDTSIHRYFLSLLPPK